MERSFLTVRTSDAHGYLVSVGLWVCGACGACGAAVRREGFRAEQGGGGVRMLQKTRTVICGSVRLERRAESQERRQESDPRRQKLCESLKIRRSNIIRSIFINMCLVKQFAKE